MNQKVKLYYMRGAGRHDSSKQNFGDYLSPLIVQMLSHKRVVWSAAKHADILAIGTIMQRLNKAKTCFGRARAMHVWGSGSGSDTVLNHTHYYHCLRGPQTSQQTLQRNLGIYGDPGLLASELVPGITRTNRRRVGIVAHYVDVNSEAFQYMKQYFPEAKIINVYSPVKEVLRAISSCEMIFSSSLHGLIVADAYGVPNQWVRFTEQFETFKFEDYFASQGIEHPPVENIKYITKQYIHQIIDSYHRPNTDNLKKMLVSSYPSSL